MTEPTTAESVCSTSSGWGGTCIDVGRPSMYLWCLGCFVKKIERLEAVGESHIAHILELERVALHWSTQRGDAVKLLRRISKPEKDGGVKSALWARGIERDLTTFLAGLASLSTPCERVSVESVSGSSFYICKRHNCAWPDEGACPSKEKVG